MCVAIRRRGKGDLAFEGMALSSAARQRGIARHPRRRRQASLRGEETPIRAGDVISTGTGKAAGRRWWQAPSGCGPYELFEVLQNDGVDCWEGEL
jgi:hypothetical protein